MLTAKNIIDKYISFFESRGHKLIPNSPIVPINDPTTLFTGSGMQSILPYLLGEVHPQGTRLVNVQNCFRAMDFDEVGDNRHTTFFRMLGNWSLGDYFNEEQIPWLFTFLTDKNEGIGLNIQNLYITVFIGDERNSIPKDTKSAAIWKKLYKQQGIDAKEVELGSEAQAAEKGMQDGRIFYYDGKKNWWSRAGAPDVMPAGEPGGPDTEVFYDFGTPHDPMYGKECHPNCDCGRFLEIGNSVFMQYKKEQDGSFSLLPKQNVDFGGGMERLLAARNNDPDIFKTNLFYPIIETIENQTGKSYKDNAREMRIIASHVSSAIFIINAGVEPSNTEQGYVLRKLIRRAIDGLHELSGKDLKPIIESVITQYKDTDPQLSEQAEKTTLIISAENETYTKALDQAKKTIEKELHKAGLKVGEELLGSIEIPAELAFRSTASLGLGPTQLKSLGYTFNEDAFAEEMKKHREVSRAGVDKKFRGGLADHSEKTVMGHTATHLMHQALRDVLGDHVHQTGSNITPERIRFDFSQPEKLTDEQIKDVEKIVNEKIQENLPVHFELVPTDEAYKMGAIGLFMDTYGEKSKIYFIGGSNPHQKGEGDKRSAYSIEFCGGPHVDFTSVLKSFKIIKQENLGKNQKRLYATVEGA